MGGLNARYQWSQVSAGITFHPMQSLVACAFRDNAKSLQNQLFQRPIPQVDGVYATDTLQNGLEGSKGFRTKRVIPLPSHWSSPTDKESKETIPQET